ncbi:MAG: sulfatase [Planctomycetota bacterium]
MHATHREKGPSMPPGRSVSVAVALFIFSCCSIRRSCADDEPLGNAVEPTGKNIVWIVVEDMSANFGCYGERSIETPNVDQLAADGVLFKNAIVTAPVCSAARSALITGMYQTSIGAHHHRSGRGEMKIELSPPIRTTPELFRDAGYLTLNLSFDDFARSDRRAVEQPAVRVAKTDYNFQSPSDLYDRIHWSQRKPQQPFFAQVQLRGGKLRGNGVSDLWPRRAEQTLGSLTEPDPATLPPYLPDDPIIVGDWSQYLDAVRYTDWEVGQILGRLRDAGELERTFVFFITDHGVSHVRNKQFCYEGGIHIPLIVRGPGLEVGATRDDVVEHIDLAATSLALAGLPVPDWMQARDVLADRYEPRRYAFAARDRCDETVDRIRAVRSERYKYLRNFHPRRPYLQPNRYKDNKPILQAMRRLHADGRLSPVQSLIMASERPAEELYDLRDDPHELRNLAGAAAHRDRLDAMRQALADWIAESDDRGRFPEGPMYDSDMVAYRGKRGATDARRDELERNVAQMKQWAAEGK